MPNDAKAAARLAANAIIANPPEAGADPITYDQLYAWGGLEIPEDGCSKEEYNRFNLLTLEFRDMVRNLVLVEIGRYLETVRGVGFRLLAPSENVSHIEDETYDQIKRTLRKAAKVVRHTRDEDLTIEERNAKTNASVRMGAMLGAVESAERNAKHEASYRNQTVASRPTIPTVGVRNT
jgi:hypothetical protein